MHACKKNACMGGKQSTFPLLPHTCSLCKHISACSHGCTGQLAYPVNIKREVECDGMQDTGTGWSWEAIYSKIPPRQMPCPNDLPGPHTAWVMACVQELLT